jgi:uncharacterized protein (TIGR01777 family)
MPELPECFISGSAIGYYGAQGDITLTESSAPHKEFTHDLCSDWEQEAKALIESDVRVCLVRTGIVLGAHGGVLKKMVPPFKMGVGGPMGSGKQWMSWIHIKDMVNALVFMIENKSLNGVYNATAPNPERNAKFSAELASALRRPAFLKTPGFVLKMIFGEMATLMLDGQKVVPERLLNAKFEFEYEILNDALSHIFLIGNIEADAN